MVAGWVNTNLTKFVLAMHTTLVNMVVINSAIRSYEMNIGRSINVALAKNDMKKSDLVKSFGWSAAYVSRICRSPEMGMGSIQKLAEFFGMQVSEFIGLGEDKA